MYIYIYIYRERERDHSYIINAYDDDKYNDKDTYYYHYYSYYVCFMSQRYATLQRTIIWYA